MALLRIRLFGAPQIFLADIPLKLARRKTLALIAYLGAGRQNDRPGIEQAPFFASRDTLSTLLWGEHSQEQAAAYLRQALWDFSQAAGEGRIYREGTVIGLSEDDLWVDVRIFEQCLYTWKTAAHEPFAVETLKDAVSLYTSDFLAGFSLRDCPEFEEWQSLRAEGLRLALAEGLEELSHFYAAQGAYDQALDFARRWLSLDELNENAQRELMRLYVASGQSSAALRQYESCQQVLHEQLGAAPEAATQQLFQQISLRRIPAQTTWAARSSRAPLPFNLPSQTTPFLGREEELSRLRQLLADSGCRFITLLGPGGSGKTRLAIQAAEKSTGYPHSPDFPHGAFFAGLAEVANEAEAVRVIAASLRLEFRIGFTETLSAEEERRQLLEFLAEKKLLLVLDNLEHLREISAFFSTILESAPGVKIIATSRESLNLAEEWIFELSGLPFPEESLEWNEANIGQMDRYPAVQLFLRTAERVNGFQLQAGDWPAIVRITRLVDGLPLGVELAAAWVKMLSCSEIAAEMERSLDFLQSKRPGFPARHSSLRAVFDHSWKLLSGRERTALQRLSIFRGGFTREAAFEAAGASLSQLASLADKSLLRRISSGRYNLHELVRQYAAEQLSANPQDWSEARERHARYYADWLHRKCADLKGQGQLEALSALRLEKQNLRLAWTWLVDQGEFAVLEHSLPDAILFFEMDGDHSTAAEWMQAAEQAARAGLLQNSPLPVQGVLGLALAGFRHFMRDLQDSSSLISIQQEGLDLSRSLPPGITRAYINMLLSTGPEGISPTETLRLSRESCQIFETAKDAWGSAMAALILADTLSFNRFGDEQARQAYEKSLETFNRLGNDWGRALCYFGLAILARRSDRLEEACRLAQFSLEIYQQLGNMGRVIDSRSVLGEICAALGRSQQARQHFTANQRYLEEVGDHHHSREFLIRLERLDPPQTAE